MEINVSYFTASAKKTLTLRRDNIVPPVVRFVLFLGGILRRKIVPHGTIVNGWYDFPTKITAGSGGMYSAARPLLSAAGSDSILPPRRRRRTPCTPSIPSRH